MTKVISIDLSTTALPLEVVEDVLAATVTGAHTFLKYHVEEPAIEPVTLGYVLASELQRAVSERLSEPGHRALMLNQLTSGIAMAALNEYDEQGLRLESGH
jgi:hypothetical protein